MGYIESTLLPGERVVYRGRLHWIIFLGPAVLSLLVIGLFLLIGAFVRKAASEFAVTNHRVVIKVGLIRRDTLELNLSKVESIGVDQTLWGRLLGFGTITVVGTGGTRESFRNLADPLGFRRAVTQAGETLAAGGAERSAGSVAKI